MCCLPLRRNPYWANLSVQLLKSKSTASSIYCSFYSINCKYYCSFNLLQSQLGNLGGPRISDRNRNFCYNKKVYQYESLKTRGPTSQDVPSFELTTGSRDPEPDNWRQRKLNQLVEYGRLPKCFSKQYLVQLGPNSILWRLYHIGDISNMQICKFFTF